MTRITGIRGLTAGSSAQEVVDGVDLDGRVAVVTGASSGIGVETARALASAGARVVLAVRRPEAGERVAEDIRRSTGSTAVAVQELVLDDLGSVDRFVDRWSGPLHVLVNNAGIMATPERYTSAGWELQFATNHLGHFALATGLHDALRDADDARVVSVASTGSNDSPVVFEDLFFLRRPYDPSEAYGQSKTANVLFAVGAWQRWAGDGITANACMPGGIWTNLQQHWDPEVLRREQARATDVVKTPQQGAATSVLLATAPELSGVGGRYFEDCREAEIVPEVLDGLHGVRDWALDPVAAERLWDVSLALLDAERRRTR
ncbi:SDR family NAD(P)-dependent oxidoreductase [Amnibacterium setariae]|uniref:Probable oxidoreductase n=1 Tax=Amnibacterium setariae TaxID=2306585 RepID=A0A3A1TXZ1_9MICO|nr:SDR family NAD(P)-dependent oxidoreductase [Amnibacterium setariae]RIX28630.1 SDR family NAD(P)-dependent oxidoreductase [Amnibacterium setariae]